MNQRSSEESSRHSFAHLTIDSYSPHLRLPDPPRPSTDVGIKALVPHPSTDPGDVPLESEAIDIFDLTPLAALKLFTASAEALVLSDDIPPTPPVTIPNTPRAPNLHLGKETEGGNKNNPVESSKVPSGLASPSSKDHEDIPQPHKTPIGSPEAHPTEPIHNPQPTPYFSIDDAASSAIFRRATLARKFYSKSAPPIPLRDYLYRLHTWCPMSTGIYLAAGFYIQRLVYGGPSPGSSPTSESTDEVDFVLPVTARTVHRLVLAALRTAMKALEDLSYPHTRFAKVGGVSEKELTRLEVSFCFLMDFELVVREDELEQVAVWMRDKGKYGA